MPCINPPINRQYIGNLKYITKRTTSASKALPSVGAISAGRRPTLSDQPPINNVIIIDGRAENMTMPN